MLSCSSIPGILLFHSAECPRLSVNFYRNLFTWAPELCKIAPAHRDQRLQICFDEVSIKTWLGDPDTSYLIISHHISSHTTWLKEHITWNGLDYADYAVQTGSRNRLGPRAIGRAQWSQWSSPRHRSGCRSIPEPLRLSKYVEHDDDQNWSKMYSRMSAANWTSNWSHAFPGKQRTCCLKGHTSWNDHTWWWQQSEGSSSCSIFPVHLTCLFRYGQVSVVQGLAKTIFTAGLHCRIMTKDIKAIENHWKTVFSWQTGIWSASRLHEVYRNC